MRWRLTVAEALLLLIGAKALVRAVRFGYWQRWLGPLARHGLAEPTNRDDQNLVRAVERATARLPGGAKCLPRAMALHWMLRRRQRESQLVIAIRSGQTRGGLDELHAWIEKAGEVLIGQLEGDFHVLARFGGTA